MKTKPKWPDPTKWHIAYDDRLKHWFVMPPTEIRPDGGYDRAAIFQSEKSGPCFDYLRWAFDKGYYVITYGDRRIVVPLIKEPKLENHD